MSMMIASYAGGPAGVVVLAAVVFSAAILHAAAGIEGFGSRTVGGEGGQVFWVDPNLGDINVDMHGVGSREHPCSLRKALSGGDRVIKFTRAGTITLNASIYLQSSCVTIDGSTAPAPGVTITHTPENHGTIHIGAPGRDIHDFLIRHVRFQGLFDRYPEHHARWTPLTVSVGEEIGGSVSNVVFDHLSMRYLQDKTSLWGRVENVTVSNCLFEESYMATLVSWHTRPNEPRRKGITFHHNVYARSGQRNPQLRGWIEDFEFVNNIVYGWTHYGMRIKNEPGEKSVQANVLNNMFLPGETRREAAVIYGWDPGPDYADHGPEENLPQGTVYTDSAMGRLYLAGNVLPAENRDQYSTIPSANPIPDWAKVTMQPAEDLPASLLGDVGMTYRDEREEALLAEVAHAAQAACG